MQLYIDKLFEVKTRYYAFEENATNLSLKSVEWFCQFFKDYALMQFMCKIHLPDAIKDHNQDAQGLVSIVMQYSDMYKYTDFGI